MNITKSYRKYLKAILKYCEEKACKKSLDEQDLKILVQAIKCQLVFSKKKTYFQEFKQKYPSLYKNVILKYQVQEKIAETNDNSKQNPEEKTDEKVNLIKSVKCTNKNENQERKTELTDRQPRRTENNGNNNISPEKAVSNDIQNKKLNPNLVCFKKGRIWKLAIQFSDEIARITNLKITQGSSEYGIEQIDNNMFLLDSMAELSIKWDDGNKKSSKSFKINKHGLFNPLIFKLGKTTSNFGRFVQYISTGSYGIIVPDSWQSNVGLSGDVLSEPESLYINGYKIHFFNLDEINTIISFHRPDNQSYQIESKGTRFLLLGNKIKDDNDDIGPLFGGNLPIIRDSQHWDNVSFIIIGEEGEGVGKLRWAIKLMPGTGQIDLSQLEKYGTIEIISKSKLSWFFLRIYDKNEDLVESLDFRFINGLEKIDILNNLSIPNSLLNKPSEVHFYHKNSCTIKVIGDIRESIQIINDGNPTKAIIPADPSWDISDWQITDTESGREVKIEILVERIWWNLCTENNLNPNNWSDRLILLNKNYFRADSQYCLTIWFPKSGWINNIFAGFDIKTRHNYKLKTLRRDLIIKLRDFSGYEKIFNPDIHLKFYIWLNNNSSKAITIAELNSKSDTVINLDNTEKRINVNNNACCTNCDHARRRFNNSWCRRLNWPQQYTIEDFNEKIKNYRCIEWRGEYQDENGNWHY